MKIALITIHKVSNYGALLQAYATKVVLSKYGDVQTIDYNNGHLNNQLNVIRFKPNIHGVKMLIHDILRYPFHYKLIKRFKSFINSRMNLTQEVTSQFLIDGNLKKFDVYVCGSDQIWNPDILNPNSNIDPIFFLSFAPGKTIKFSYASSIGHYNYNEKEKEILKKLLTSFKTISTREEDGVRKLTEIVPNREIAHVVDPTLLLSKQEWLKEFNLKEEIPKEKYILVYSVPRTELIKKAVHYFSKRLNLKVYTIDKMLLPITKVDKHIRNAGPKEYITLFANASFIITDSFHGTCFSVNFNKPFVAISVGKKTNRILSLLNVLQLNNQIMYDEKDFEKVKTVVDYSEVNPRLINIRNYSLNFIEQSLITK